MTEEKPKRQPIDWESVEREYRAGIRSLADIGKEYGVSAPGILKRAKKEGWDRDLSAKIKAKAEAKVNAAVVNGGVNAEAKVSEAQIVDVSSNVLADAVLNQRADVKRARATVQRLWALVDAELDHPDELHKLGDMLRAPDEFGNDKLNDLYFAAIGLPQQVKNVKLLADAIKVMIELERKVLKIDTLPDTDPDGSGSGGGTGGRRITMDFSDFKALAIG